MASKSAPGALIQMRATSLVTLQQAHDAIEKTEGMLARVAPGHVPADFGALDFRQDAAATDL